MSTLSLITNTPARPEADELFAVVARQSYRTHESPRGFTCYIVEGSASEMLVWNVFDTEQGFSHSDEAHIRPSSQEWSLRKTWLSPSTIDLSTESTTYSNLDYYLDTTLASLEESAFDVDTRLVPPALPQRRIKAKIRFIGNEMPRIALDPEMG